MKPFKINKVTVTLQNVGTRKQDFQAAGPSKQNMSEPEIRLSHPWITKDLRKDSEELEWEIELQRKIDSQTRKVIIFFIQTIKVPSTKYNNF